MFFLINKLYIKILNRHLRFFVQVSPLVSIMLFNKI